MRAMTGDDASRLEHLDRQVVDSTYNLLSGSVAYTVDVLRAFSATGGPAPVDVQVLRPGRINPVGIDASPPADTERLTFDVATKRVTQLVLEVLPLVPVYESVDVQSDTARQATNALHEQLDAAYLRGHLLGELRWVLDARRADALRTAFNSPTTCGLLEETLLTQPKLTPVQINDPNWHWWRIDANSLADYGRIQLGAQNGPFANRRLLAPFVPVLHPALPRLTGLFSRRHVVVSPGHGLFAEPPLGAALNQQLSARAGWNLHAGEDENTAIIAIEMIRAVKANGARATGSREGDDLTLGGLVQTAADTFAASPLTDFPRLWQQNAYYWLAAGGDPIVIGHSGMTTASNGNAKRDDMQKNNDGINDRLALFSQLAARTTRCRRFRRHSLQCRPRGSRTSVGRWRSTSTSARW